MATTYPVAVSAAQVGTYFVSQYYHVLKGQPDLVHQFYTEMSTMLRVDGDVVEKATTMLQIHNLILSLNFTSIEIKTAHSLDSWNGGVLVMVRGSVNTREYNGWRNFVQSFFLAPQEKGYFVLNDIFEYLDEEQLHQHLATELASSSFDSNLATSNPLPEPEPDYVLKGDIHSIDYGAPVHVEESETVDKYSIPEAQQQVPEADGRFEDEELVEEHVASFQSVTNTLQDPPAAAVEEPVGEPPKQSVSRGQSIHSAPQLSSIKNNPVASERHHELQHASQQSQSVTSMAHEKANMETDDYVTQEDEGESRSVYVRNLPSSVSAAELEMEFKNFGRIKPDGVLVKSRKEAGVYYAFVEFEDAVGVQNALKASPIQFNGRQIHVEERRPNTGAPRGGRRGRGRGGVQTEALRGRFGGRTYGRGNDFYSRGSRQERGILGPQFSRNGHYSSDAAS